MEIENLNEKVKKQAKVIRKLRRENLALKREIEKLNKDLYFENEQRPSNHQTVFRVKDIVKKFSVGKSTVWLYANKGYITPIKNSSRVTTFDAKEVISFFKRRNKEAVDISPKEVTAIIAKERQKRLKNSPQTPLNKKISKK